MKLKKLLISVLSFVLIMVLVVSCVPARRPNNTTPRTSPGPRQTRFVPRTAPGMPGTTPGMPGTTPRRPGTSPIPAPGPMTRPRMTSPAPRRVPSPGLTSTANGNMEQRARRIADEAAKTKDVKSATCVITGNTALVGLQFNKQYKGRLTDAIKRNVETSVKRTDTGVNKVVVTADPDIYSRLKGMVSDIGKGRPLSGFASEITEIINRIEPKTGR